MIVDIKTASGEEITLYGQGMSVEVKEGRLSVCVTEYSGRPVVTGDVKSVSCRD